MTNDNDPTYEVALTAAARAIHMLDPALSEAIKLLDAAVSAVRREHPTLTAAESQRVVARDVAMAIGDRFGEFRPEWMKAITEMEKGHI